MDWTQTLDRQIDSTYRAAHMLLDHVQEADLPWKPPLPSGAEGTGFMTMGQLLKHLATASGAVMKAFATGDWAMFGGGGDEPAAAHEMPSVAAVAEARAELEADEKISREMVRRAGEQRMNEERITAPWGIEGTLGEQFLDCVSHLGQHKAQLFYYLKLLGRPVNTMHLWGMEG